ncbi:PREDICTED: adaptin ear-binding coat-associated protein 2-like [Thamnophis sirtalis]|uniref:Adaptin ear-binding coat-associated protein 2-like n=1 Tax=Thamnophis sirtalis TaxID=35019 RepID=A0A6I9X7B2_9SAUR|nr:PREDICTED: adaptin ear-binding coat-associated protein 2-like [Thamnophis sirtalis]
MASGGERIYRWRLNSRHPLPCGPVASHLVSSLCREGPLGGSCCKLELRVPCFGYDSAFLRSLFQASCWANLQPATSAAFLSLVFLTGRRAFIGIGFVDRGDAFDFNVALQDHFKWVKQQTELAKEAQNPTQVPKLDLGFKDGQTITLSIGNMKKKDGSLGSKPRTADNAGLPLLPPPPGGKTPFLPTPEEQLPLPPLGTSVDAVQTDVAESRPPQPPSSSREASVDIWGDFTTASGSGSQPQQNSGWVQF